jgi:hypothetical protein
MAGLRAWWFVVVVLAALVVACGRGSSAERVETPAFARIALGADDADVVGAFDLRAMRSDPVFGPIVERIARTHGAAALSRASQIDLVASVDRGKTTTWLGVVHGVSGEPRDGDIGSTARREIVVAPGAWITGEGAAFERLRAGGTTGVRSIELPRRALVAVTARGRALEKSKTRTAEGLKEGTVAILGGDHLEIVVQCRYEDSAAARRAVTAAKLELAVWASGHRLAEQLVSSLVKITFDVSGDVVTARLTIDDDLRALLEHYVRR